LLELEDEDVDIKEEDVVALEEEEEVIN